MPLVITLHMYNSWIIKELQRHGLELHPAAEKIRRVGSCGKWKSNIERDTVRALTGTLGMETWLIFFMGFVLCFKGWGRENCTHYKYAIGLTSIIYPKVSAAKPIYKSYYSNLMAPFAGSAFRGQGTLVQVIPPT